jgi:hypothetical protein
MVMIWRGFGSICLAGTSYSEILYIVIMTLKCAIFSLYVVFVLIWLHLSFIVFNSISRIFHGGKL